MRSLRNTVSTLLGIAALTLSAVAVSGTAAAASPAVVHPLACSHPSWSNKDDQTGRVDDITADHAAIHDGPSAECTVIAQAYPADLLQYHCYVFNSAGNTWTHLRIDGTNINGWVWDEYLDDDGSLYKC